MLRSLQKNSLMVCFYIYILELVFACLQKNANASIASTVCDRDEDSNFRKLIYVIFLSYSVMGSYQININDAKGFLRV